MWRWGEAPLGRANGSRPGVGQWEDAAWGRQKSLPVPSLRPITPNCVLSDPSAPSALTSQLSGILLPSLESFRLTQLSQVVDAFPEFCSHVHTPTYPQKATPEIGRLG